jgi:hypothetical protein
MHGACAGHKLQRKEDIPMYKVALTALCALSMLAPLAAQAGEVSHRETRQQHRIYQGVHNGSVTPAEYNHLEREEYRLNAQRERDVSDVKLNREENHLSRQIYRAKHNGRP